MKPSHAIPGVLLEMVMELGVTAPASLPVSWCGEASDGVDHDLAAPLAATRRLRRRSLGMTSCAHERFRNLK